MWPIVATPDLRPSLAPCPQPALQARSRSKPVPPHRLPQPWRTVLKQGANELPRCLYPWLQDAPMED
ncbi:hypothetical protein E2C01_039449 [Portunus trituberculatus]|uniref:Uncharacterized protein n=1 Tax=Portunus trituberculatus TaxID=210409 RepID=A0A5B7FKQ2_PORTR|nr:hypothetical protein [Portunus trituberculatus]